MITPNIDTLFFMFLVSFLVSIYASIRGHWTEMGIGLFFIIASVLGILFKMLQ